MQQTNTSIDDPLNDAQAANERSRLTMSVTEAAEWLGISRAFAYELVARGELPSLRLGRRVLIPTKRLYDFVLRDEAK